MNSCPAEQNQWCFLCEVHQLRYAAGNRCSPIRTEDAYCTCCLRVRLCVFSYCKYAGFLRVCVFSHFQLLPCSIHLPGQLARSDSSSQRLPGRQEAAVTRSVRLVQNSSEVKSLLFMPSSQAISQGPCQLLTCAVPSCSTLGALQEPFKCGVFAGGMRESVAIWHRDAGRNGKVE